tara:strand:- start:264 stop:443 length:180 start_codon:yes stop_codon:yes gene_type:complete
MTNKELINILKKLPKDAIVQINSRHNNFNAEDIFKVFAEDEHNNTINFSGQVYIDIIGE